VPIATTAFTMPMWYSVDMLRPAGEKRISLVSAFPYVCPEPVMANDPACLYENGVSKRRFFAPVRSSTIIPRMNLPLSREILVQVRKIVSRYIMYEYSTSR
jgi:hypothetical protein